METNRPNWILHWWRMQLSSDANGFGSNFFCLFLVNLLISRSLLIAEANTIDYIDVSTKMGLGDVAADSSLFAGNMMPRAVVDWDGDTNDDMLVSPFDNLTSLEFLRYDGSRFLPVSTTGGPVVFSSDILSVTATDLDRDGLPDAIVGTRDGSVWGVRNSGVSSTTLAPWWNDTVTTTGTPTQLLPANTVRFPALMDYLNIFGDCAQPSIIAASFINDSSSGPLLIHAQRARSQCDDADTSVFTSPGLISCPMAGSNAVPGYTAGVDVDGDCVAETIVAMQEESNSNQMLRFYISNARPKLSECVANDAANTDSNYRAPWLFPAANTKSFTVPLSWGVPTWGDFNADGAADVAFPACADPTTNKAIPCADNSTDFNAIIINYNKLEGSACPDSLCCKGFNGWGFGNLGNGDDSNTDFQVIFLSALSSSTSNTDATFACDASLPQDRVSRYDAVPTFIQALDYDYNRHLDFLLRTTNGPRMISQSNLGQFTCVPLSSWISGCSGNCSQALESSVTQPFSYDVASDGRPSLFFSARGIGMYAFDRTLNNVHYFLTSVVKNGARGGSPNNFAVPQFGATHRFQFINFQSQLSSATAHQLASTAGPRLSSGRVHVGLYITFSYVQNYAVGFRVEDLSAPTRQFGFYLPPNSQIIVQPIPLSEPSQWSLTLFLQGQKYLKLVLIVFGTSLGAIGIPILLLGRKEVIEGRKARRKAAHF